MTGTPLAGGSYVLAPADLDFHAIGGWSEAVVVDRERGARALSQYAVRLDTGTSEWRSYPGAESVLFVLGGAGRLEFSDRSFDLGRECGVFVAPGEAFRAHADGADGLRMTLTVCPEARPAGPGAGGDFDPDRPERLVAAADQARHATGERFYQLLVDTRVGCHNVTQFIGGIPRSRAPEHFHEYEEAITILDGEGFMHTGERSAPVAAGSMIFLARGQRHSLECTSAGGMRLAGIFHPSGSPAVSYE